MNPALKIALLIVRKLWRALPSPSFASAAGACEKAWAKWMTKSTDSPMSTEKQMLSRNPSVQPRPCTVAPTHDRTEKMHTVAYKDTTGSRVPSRQMMELMTIAMIAAL